MCLAGVFEQACTHILRVFHSADIGIYTGHPIATYLHALCLNSWPAAFSASLDLSSASDSLTASSQQTLLQRLCNTLSPTCMAMHHMPHSCAKHPIPYLCYTDPDGLPSFADQYSFGNWSSDSTPEKTQILNRFYFHHFAGASFNLCCKECVTLRLTLY